MLTSQTDKLSVILAILCALTGVVAWYAEIPGLPGGKSIAPRADAPGGQDSPVMRVDRAGDGSRPAIGHYSEILDRPLFDESRRPAVAIVADTLDDVPRSAPAQTRNAGLKLVGIMIIEEKRFALLQTSRGGVAQRVKVGDEIDGWRVSALSPDSAILDRGAHSKTIEIERKGDPRAVAKAKALAASRLAQRKKQSAIRGLPEPPAPDRSQSPANKGGESPGNDDNDTNDDDDDDDDE